MGKSCRMPLLRELMQMATQLAWAFVILAMTASIGSHKASAADNAADHKIGSSAVWQPGEQFVTNAHKACDSSPGSNFAECFIDQMTKAGAPNDAVAFTRELYKFNHGDIGIMRGFQAVGPVDIAWIEYPLRANTNNGLLLVNGKPAIIDMEDLKLLDKKGMEQSPQFKDVKARFPNVDLWPGDRDGKTWPNSQKGANGGIQFVADYPLINGCHACARVGSVYFNWNFDADGKFIGTTFIGMTPPPLQ